MTATCVVRRLNGTTLNEDYEVVPAYDVVYGPTVEPHKGKCKLRNWNGYESKAESAGATAVELRSETHFPVGALDVMVGDIVTVLAVPEHPLLAGRSARVAGRVPLASLTTADRVYVDENVGQEVPPWTG